MFHILLSHIFPVFLQSEWKNKTERAMKMSAVMHYTLINCMYNKFHMFQSGVCLKLPN